MGGYYILKKFNKKEIPGIHTDIKDAPAGIQEQLGALTGQGGPQGDPNGAEKDADSGAKENGGPKENGGAKENGKPKEANGGPKHPGGYKGAATKHANGVADKVGSVGKASGVDVANPKEAADVGKHAGKVTNAAQGVKGGVTGVTGLG